MERDAWKAVQGTKRLNHFGLCFADVHWQFLEVLSGRGLRLATQLTSWRFQPTPWQILSGARSKFSVLS
jgi:hypothetical protein